MSGSLITWRRTWPEGGPDFIAVVAGGSFARLYRERGSPDLRGDWVWSLTYPAETGLTKAGRAKTKKEAATAVHRSLGEVLRWHGERGEPLVLWRHGPILKGRTDGQLQDSVHLAVGGDVPWPEGWGSETKNPPGDGWAG